MVRTKRSSWVFKSSAAPSQPAPRPTLPTGAPRAGRPPAKHGSSLASSSAHFSLQDEAANTGHHAHGTSPAKLRYAPVSFVSAGALKSTIAEDEPSAARLQDGLAQMSIDSTKTSARPSSSELMQTPAATTDNEEPLFVVDTVGSGLPPPLSLKRPSLSPPTFRASSPTPSSSSDEVVFKGREPVPTSANSVCTPTHSVRTITDSVRTVPTSTPNQSSGKSEAVAERPSWDTSTVDWVHRSKPGIGWANPADLVPKRRVTHKKRVKREHEDQHAEAVADYIKNIQAQEGASSSFNDGPSVFKNRDLSLMDGNDDFATPDDPETRCPAEQAKQATQDAEWEATHLNDFDNISTSNELSVPVLRILSKRERCTVVQYLVVYDGFMDDDAKWIPESTLNSSNDLELIHLYEAAIEANAHSSITSSLSIDGDSDDNAFRLNFDEDEDDDEDDNKDDDEDEDDDSEDESDSDDDQEDEKDLVERKKASLEDEDIARLLAKQEELGMGSEELLLLDGAVKGFEEDIEANETFLNSFLQSRRSKKRQTKRAKGEFPPASLLADVVEQDPYNGFDVMDFERPSLKKKSKGRKGTLPFELSDDDLQQTIAHAWENDRSAKAKRKQQREELRAEGMLGKTDRLDRDPKARYSEGISMNELKAEMKEFLMSSKQTLPLPPMGDKDRKHVHIFAHNFGLKSKSAGKGKYRFPTLIKTNQTVPFNAEDFDAVEFQGNRGFIPRMSAQGKGKGKFQRGGGPKATYRDGDVVGAAAPEIGTENRGRAMLEKMGWSTGTALGALNNKGILTPVTHIVKTSKAGLG